ncbi:MAG: hypothetical protein J6Y30_03515 [Treponema sp.]|nr:hypothetical protein [Treponema sp.]
MDFPRYCRTATQFCTLLSRACPKKILPWIFLGIGDLQANLRVAKPPLHGLFNANQERYKESHLQTVRFFTRTRIPKEGKIWTWPVGRRKKARSAGPAPEKSLSGFFWGLQNRCAILQAAKPPSMALYCLARKKSISCFFYTDVKYGVFRHIAKR